MAKAEPVNKFGKGWYYNSEKKMTIYIPPKNKKKKKLVGDWDEDEEGNAKVIK
jgi:hypothetical protein